MNFDGDLDHAQGVIRLRDAKFPNGARDWDLTELDAEGLPMGRAFKPWHWECSFEAFDAKLHKIVASVQNTTFDEYSRPDSIERRSVISIQLRPKSKGLRYSMLGTSRQIEDIELKITALGDEQERERCRASSGLKLRRASADLLSFEVEIRPSDFEYYGRLIASQSLDQICFKARRVAGFYSEFSEDIGPNGVKVLTEWTEHKVDETARISDDPIPRIGDVAEFTLSVSTRQALKVQVEAAEKVVPALTEQAALIRDKIDFSPLALLLQRLQATLYWLLAFVGFLIAVALLR